jgi:hypothetical protein
MPGAFFISGKGRFLNLVTENPSSRFTLQCSLVSTYRLINKHMHLDFLASIHLNQTVILQMQAVRSSQTLQQNLATECKNKEKEKGEKKRKEKNPFGKQP